MLFPIVFGYDPNTIFEDTYIGADGVLGGLLMTNSKDAIDYFEQSTTINRPVPAGTAPQQFQGSLRLDGALNGDCFMRDVVELIPLRSRLGMIVEMMNQYKIEPTTKECNVLLIELWQSLSRQLNTLNTQDSAFLDEFVKQWIRRDWLSLKPASGILDRRFRDFIKEKDYKAVFTNNIQILNGILHFDADELFFHAYLNSEGAEYLGPDYMEGGIVTNSKDHRMLNLLATRSTNYLFLRTELAIKGNCYMREVLDVISPNEKSQIFYSLLKSSNVQGGANGLTLQCVSLLNDLFEELKKSTFQDMDVKLVYKSSATVLPVMIKRVNSLYAADKQYPAEFEVVNTHGNTVKLTFNQNGLRVVDADSSNSPKRRRTE